MKPSAITSDQWMKVLRVVIYVAVSLIIAIIPAVLAHNPKYLSLAAPINVVLVMLQQLFTPSQTVKADTQETMDVVNKVVSEVTDTQGNPVTDPNAPR